MRVNVYAEEMTGKVELIEKVVEGDVFVGVRFYLELPVTMPAAADGTVEQKRGPFLHGLGDDDSAAVTFWGKRQLRESLKMALKLLNERHRYDELLNERHRYDQKGDPS